VIITDQNALSRGEVEARELRLLPKINGGGTQDGTTNQKLRGLRSSE
jgi:hypothetical protein